MMQYNMIKLGKLGNHILTHASSIIYFKAK